MCAQSTSNRIRSDFRRQNDPPAFAGHKKGPDNPALFFNTTLKTQPKSEPVGEVQAQRTRAQVDSAVTHAATPLTGHLCVFIG